VTKVSWHPDGGRKIAVAYSVLQFQSGQDDLNVSSYIWDLENPNFPEMELVPPSPLCSIEYSPKDPHILVGGSYNGLVSYWDTRKGSQAAGSSAVEFSHRDPVYDVRWIQSKTGSEFFSVSTDGFAYWWDIRKLSEGPTDTLELVPKGSETMLGGVRLDYDLSLPTRFMVGTEQGLRAQL